MKGHAEIAGGGIGGLSVGMMLARHGWTVRVHERSPEIREIGAGIYIKNNSIEVLEEFGVFDKLAPRGTRLERAEVVRYDGKLLQRRPLAGHSRVYVFPRQALIESLRDAALEAGVEIVTDSHAVAAEESGTLVLENGRRYKGDLIIAADGVRSKVRDSLSLGATYRPLATNINRYLLPTREITPDAVTREHWSGYWRIGITPADERHTYVYQVCPDRDAAAKKLPNDVALWTRAFPRLRRELELFAQADATQYHYHVVSCPRWQRGRVAILGDAAHGLPPTLGQGAGLTIMNSRALVAVLDRATSAEEGIAEWERAVRFISDRTQTWAVRYDWFTRQWPESLGFLKPSIVWAFRNFPALNERMRIADKGLRQTSIELRRLRQADEALI